MLKPIKIFYAGNLPTFEDWQEAVRIAKEEECVVQVIWYPNRWAGYYHEYVHDFSNPEELDKKTPKAYGC
jgi:hypothetical protein